MRAEEMRWAARGVPAILRSVLLRSGLLRFVFLAVCGLCAPALFGQSPATPASATPASTAPATVAPAASVPATATPPEAASPATPASATAAPAPAADAPAPIAIVPNDNRDANAAVEIRGGVDIYSGKAAIESSGTVTAGEHTVPITLPQRGELRLCSTSKVSLTMDSQNQSTDHSGLMMALDHGAMEANLRTGENSDIVLTPDFRILISGPGVAAVRVRLGPGGDTCVDNHGADAPYVTVTSLFEDGLYRVQADQRVMFQHGSLKEVVDNEKEPCGCPPDAPEPSRTQNAFPLAQSEGLAKPPEPKPNQTEPGVVGAQASATLQYDGGKKAAKASVETAEPVTPVPPPAPPAKKSKPKSNVFRKLGNFFRNLFVG